jgi:succinyl-diaminopimelate desuccinylase
MRRLPREELTELASALVRIPSHNPPGNEDRIARFAADRLGEAGLDPQFVSLEPERSSIVCRLPGREGSSIVLCGHLDTVGTEAAAWKVPPLEGRIEDGRLWGLGASDMKGPVAVLMQLIADLHRKSIKPTQDLVLVLTADEEVGYRGAATVANSGLIDDAELLLIAEPTAGHVYTGQKGELWIEVSFHGQEAHGSTPELGINTILPAARFCTRLQDEMAELQPIEGRGKTTLNIGQFRGGRRVNIVPDRSTVQLDIRTVRLDDRNGALDRIDRIGHEEAKASGTTFECRVASYHPPIVSAPVSPHGRRLIRAVADTSGREPPIGISPYSTDAVSIVPRLDLPVLIYGPGDIARAHQPNEFIEIDELVAAYEALRRFVS